MLTGDLNIITRQIRRLVSDPLVSGTGVRSNLEILEYCKDSLPEIETDFPDFPTFTISGTSISPTPDSIDKRLIAIKASELITYENWMTNAGDAILIKTGSISLDTSKGTRFFKDVYEALVNRYDNLINDLNMNGKSSSTGGIGTRVDNYIERSGDTKVGDSLL